MSERGVWWHVKQFLIAVDQAINTCRGGWADETLSSYAYRKDAEQGKPLLRKIIDALLFFDEDHCYQSYLSEIERRQLPPSMRS